MKYNLFEIHVQLCYGCFPGTPVTDLGFIGEARFWELIFLHIFTWNFRS